MTQRERLLRAVLKYNERMLFEEYRKGITVQRENKIVEMKENISRLRKRIKDPKRARPQQMQFSFEKPRRNWFKFLKELLPPRV